MEDGVLFCVKVLHIVIKSKYYSVLFVSFEGFIVQNFKGNL